MLQGTPAVKEGKDFKQILQDFAMAVGTKVGLTKSKVFFFNTNIAIQRNLSRILSFQRDHLPSKYMGIPLMEKPLSKEVWEPLTNKLKDKVSKWTSRSLNLAGRLVLTKAALQTIPIYMFSALPVPRGVVQQIRNIQRDFIWGKGEEKKKWALVAWDKLCKPKTHGGLGLHDPNTLNKVLGAKLWWRWLNETRNPWVKLWKQKYAKDCDYWDQTRNNNKWRTWKLPVYSEETPLKAQAEALATILEKRKFLISTFIDQLRWGRNSEGNFNLKEAKEIATGHNMTNPNKIWKDLWKNPHWMKIKLFVWMVQHKNILTWENLRKKGFAKPSRCQLCGLQEESMDHILNLCTFTSTLWN
eukprot:PITA_17321